MIVRKWVAVAACIMAFAGPTCAQPQGESDKGNRQQQDTQPKQPEPEPSKPNVRTPPTETKRADQSPTQPKVYEPDCGKPKDQPEADLCVQRRVADAAEGTLHWSKIQTGGALVGLVLVLATLGVTAWTGKAAAIAAQAAVDAVGAERAWISVQRFNTNPTSSLIVNGADQGAGYLIDIAWINAGRSPAVNLELSIGVQEVCAGASPPEFVVPEDQGGTSGVIGPGIGVKTKQVAIFGQILSDFIAQKIDLYVYSEATYETISAPGVLRKTFFTAKLEQNGNTTAPNGDVVPMFTMHSYGANGAT